MSLISFGTPVGFDTSNTFGATVTASATANNPGSWVVLASSLDRNFSLVVIGVLLDDTAGSGTWAGIDIGIGALGSEVVKILNLPIARSGNKCTTFVPLPIRFASGQRVVARMRCSTASQTAQIYMLGFCAADYEAFRNACGGAECINFNLGTSKATQLTNGAGANTPNAWTPLNSSVSRNYRGIVPTYLTINNNNASKYTAYEVGVGTLGNESIILPWVGSTLEGRETTLLSPLMLPIASGQRVVGRYQENAPGGGGDEYLGIMGLF